MPEAETRLATTCIVQLPLSLNVRVTALFISFLLGLFPSSRISALVLDFFHPLYGWRDVCRKGWMGGSEEWRNGERVGR